MRKQDGRSWWMSLGLGKPAVDDSDDFGDMGTAFGLDASMGPSAPADAAGQGGSADVQAPAASSDRRWRRSSF